MKRYMLLAAAAAFALVTAGCAHNADGSLDPVQTTYNAGQVEVEVLNFASVLPAVPAKLCGPIRALNDAYFGWEKVVTDPNFDPKNVNQALLAHLPDLVNTVVQAAIDLGFSLLAPKPHFNLVQHDWDTLNTSITAGLSHLHC